MDRKKKRIFLFPGQGTQYVGMGKDFYEKFDEAKYIFNRVSNLLGINVEKICFEGPVSKLNEIKYTQVAILTVSLAILEILKKNNIEASWSAGLSLGEYTSLIYAGIIDFETGIKLVYKRGEIMQKYLPKMEFLMAAIISSDINIIKDVCKEQQIRGEDVYVSNQNSSKQIVISGKKESVEKTIEILKSINIKKIIKLNTMGPFHTKLMERAKEEYKKEIKNIEFKFMNDIKVLKNIDASLYSSKDNVVEVLLNHITKPVNFFKEIEKMKEENIEEFIEIGTGEVLTGCIKKEILNAKTYNINTTQNLIDFLGEIKDGK